MSILEKELDFISRDKLDSVATSIVDRLQLQNAFIYNLNDVKRGHIFPSKTEDVVANSKKNITLTMDDILLVEKYNGVIPNLYIESFYIDLVKWYFRVIGNDENNAAEIYSEEYIGNILSSLPTDVNNPTANMKCPKKSIRDSIDVICNVIPLYRNFHYNKI